MSTSGTRATRWSWPSTTRTQGADEIVFLDITATSDDRDTVADVVERTAEQVFVPLTVGGGIRTLEDFQLLLRAGADKISVNSAAVKDPTLISRAAERFGSQCVVLAIDARRQTETAPGRWWSPEGAIPPGWTQWSGPEQGQRAGGGGDSSHLHGRRRHQGGL